LGYLAKRLFPDATRAVLIVLGCNAAAMLAMLGVGWWAWFRWVEARGVTMPPGVQHRLAHALARGQFLLTLALLILLPVVRDAVMFLLARIRRAT